MNRPTSLPSTRRLPVGAELLSPTTTHFRVWAPAHRRVRVRIEETGEAHELAPGENGYFSGDVAGVGAGARYGYLLDDDEHLDPGPATRFQPDGVHGPSLVVDPEAYEWRDD